MAETQALSESVRVNYFNTTHYISVYVGCTTFNAVMKPDKKNKKEFKNFYDDLPACATDCKDMKETLQCYQFNRKEHTYDMKNPSSMLYLRTMAKIKMLRLRTQEY